MAVDSYFRVTPGDVICVFGDLFDIFRLWFIPLLYIQAFAFFDAEMLKLNNEYLILELGACSAECFPVTAPAMVSDFAIGIKKPVRITFHAY